MQVNLIWHDAYDGKEYVNSSPIVFDHDRMLFYCRMRVQELRVYGDPESFSRLPKWKMSALLQGPVDHARNLLVCFFPEVEQNAGLLRVEYFMSTGGTEGVIARYSNGQLQLMD